MTTIMIVVRHHLNSNEIRSTSVSPSAKLIDLKVFHNHDMYDLWSLSLQVIIYHFLILLLLHLLGFVSKQESPTTTLDSQILFNLNSTSPLPLCDILPHSQRKFFFVPVLSVFLVPLCHICQKSYCNNNIILAIMVPLFLFFQLLFSLFYNRCHCIKFGWNLFFWV